MKLSIRVVKVLLFACIGTSDDIVYKRHAAKVACHFFLEQKRTDNGDREHEEDY